MHMYVPTITVNDCALFSILMLFFFKSFIPTPDAGKAREGGKYHWSPRVHTDVM